MSCNQPLSHRRSINTTILANSKPLVVHTERSTTGVKTNCCVNHTERDVTVYVMMMVCVCVCVFSRCFPGVPSVNLNLRISYSHMDAVLMCCA